MTTPAPQGRSGFLEWLLAQRRGFLIVLTAIYGANAICWGLGLLDGVGPVGVIFTVIWTIASGVAVIFLLRHLSKAPNSSSRK